MDLSTTLRLEVDHVSAAVDARRVAAALAARISLPEEAIDRARLAVTEMVTNLCRHARSGILLLNGRAAAGLEVLALDQGPGIADLGQALRDGFSTAGGAGSGLGALRRLSDDFEIHSRPGQGTAILCRFSSRAGGRHDSAAHGGPTIGWASTPMPGEISCGDAWDVHLCRDGRAFVIVVDGLGHGVEAARGSRKALEIFRRAPELAPERQVEEIHRGVAEAKVRGSALAVAQVSADGGELSYCGCGNIHGQILAPGESHSLLSLPGIVGQRIRTLKPQRYPLPRGARLAMASDGLRRPWSLRSPTGILGHQASLLAAILYRDHWRGNDDATVVVLDTGLRGEAQAVG